MRSPMIARQFLLRVWQPPPLPNPIPIQSAQRMAVLQIPAPAPTGATIRAAITAHIRSLSLRLTRRPRRASHPSPRQWIARVCHR